MKKIFTFAMMMIVSSAMATEKDLPTDMVKENGKVASAQEVKVVKKASWTDHIKLSGNVQMQWQMAQEKGAEVFSPMGNFADDSNNRFDIRRARLKMTYGIDFFTAKIQMNANQKGVSVVEANLALHNKSKTMMMTTGLFYKPFGYLIQRSSSIRQQPELPRVVQSLLKDVGIGAYGSITGEKGTFLNQFKLDLGVMTEDEKFNQTRQFRNLIGRIDFNQPIGDNSVVGAEFSTYLGGLKNKGNIAYESADNGYDVINDATGKVLKRDYYDFGVRYETVTGWGDTKIFGEYMFGTQVGNDKSSKSSSIMMDKDAPLFQRNFSGMYLYFQQEIANSDVSLMFQLDTYDPNTKIGKEDIGKFENTSGVDVAHTSLGVGLFYKFLKEKVAVSAVYDFVWNEECPNLANFKTNRKDNLFTLRLLCAF
ncbi:MAG: hypothetical protein IMY73_02225 [Bacteroidetes bacterium]|nr:hypothetical protein [Bacteroidota bacterium]